MSSFREDKEVLLAGFGQQIEYDRDCESFMIQGVGSLVVDRASYPQGTIWYPEDGSEPKVINESLLVWVNKAQNNLMMYDGARDDLTVKFDFENSVSQGSAIIQIDQTMEFLSSQFQEIWGFPDGCQTIPLIVELELVDTFNTRINQVYVPHAHDEVLPAIFRQINRILRSSVPFMSQGPPSQVLTSLGFHLRKRITTLNQHCCICDGPVEYPTPSLTVCTKSLCNFAMMKLGLAQHASFHDSHVLLFDIMRQAVMAHDCKLCLEPVPTLLDASGNVLMDKDNFDFDMLRTELKQSKSVDEALVQSALARSLALWSISCHASHLKRLDEPILGSLCSYKIIAQTPEHEETFKNRLLQSQSQKSRIVFHGTSSSRLHRILHQGLVVGTKENGILINGQAYGQGIYCSPELMTASGYARQAYSLSSSSSSSSSLPQSETARRKESFCNLRYILVCEVIEDNASKKNSSIWVVEEKTDIVTRFLIGFRSLSKEPDMEEVEPVLRTLLA